MSASSTDVLETIAAGIGKEYEELGHTLGWRFLYGPARTLHWAGKLLLLGLNPGGNYHVAPRCSVEAGNAYRVERWGRDGSLNPLQTQVGHLFEHLAAATRDAHPHQLMDDTATANFCPFRSPNWKLLQQRKASIDFSHRLWSKLIREATPAVSLCIGHQTGHYFRRVYHNAGWRLKSSTAWPTGWGGARVRMNTFDGDGDESVVISLPHLSRYQFLGRPQGESAAQTIACVIAKRIGW